MSISPKTAIEILQLVNTLAALIPMGASAARAWSVSNEKVKLMVEEDRDPTDEEINELAAERTAIINDIIAGADRPIARPELVSAPEPTPTEGGNGGSSDPDEGSPAA